MIAAADLDPAKLRAAFYAGIEYHDALMLYSEGAPGQRNTLVGPQASENLNAKFEAWHRAIADALGVAP